MKQTYNTGSAQELRKIVLPPGFLNDPKLKLSLSLCGYQSWDLQKGNNETDFFYTSL